MYSGGTLKGQHERTADMLTDFAGSEEIATRIVWFLYDSQTTHDQLRDIAQILQDRQSRKRATSV